MTHHGLGRLAIIITVLVTALATAAATGTALAQPPAGPPGNVLNLHRVNWADVTIPGALCRVKSTIRLHKGQARISRSGYGPLQVLTSGPAYGDLGHGQQVAALAVWCDNQGGTAAGELAQGLAVSGTAGSRLYWLGTLTPQYRPRGGAHIPFISAGRIGRDRIVTTEYWYASGDPDCCPTGRASTSWVWNGHRFLADRTVIW